MTEKGGRAMEIVAMPQEGQPKKKKRGVRGKINWRAAFTKRRKIMILAGMFVLLVVTGYLNFTLNSNRSDEVGGGGTAGTGQTVFQMFRQTRQAERTSQLAILENIALSESYSATARAQAEQQKLQLLANMHFETMAEGFIMNEGWVQDVVVSKNGENINVLVRNPENLTAVQITRVTELLNRAANRTIDIDNIFISIVE